MLWSAGCSLMRAEGFFCSLEVLFGGLICKLQFLIKKNTFNFFLCCKFFFPFLFIKTLDPDWIRIRISVSLKCWIRIRNQYIPTDPKHCFWFDWFRLLISISERYLIKFIWKSLQIQNFDLFVSLSLVQRHVRYSILTVSVYHLFGLYDIRNDDKLLAHWEFGNFLSLWENKNFKVKHFISLSVGLLNLYAIFLLLYLLRYWFQRYRTFVSTGTGTWYLCFVLFQSSVRVEPEPELLQLDHEWGSLPG
jgi:hypothetical protein